jgi:hypothetical protein
MKCMLAPPLGCGSAPLVRGPPSWAGVRPPPVQRSAPPGQVSAHPWAEVCPSWAVTADFNNVINDGPRYGWTSPTPRNVFVTRHGSYPFDICLSDNVACFLPRLNLLYLFGEPALTYIKITSPQVKIALPYIQLTSICVQLAFNIQ